MISSEITVLLIHKRLLDMMEELHDVALLVLKLEEQIKEDDNGE